MVIAKYIFRLTAISALACAGLVHRTVTELDQAAFEEAQQRDDTAIRAFSNTKIKTSDGKCLYVDKLSGDFRANLTPIQVAACGTTSGQGWDVITQGKHNNVNGSVLIVSTLTQACFNYDPRRAAGNQVFLFSCGGRADGSGNVTDSQLFVATEGAAPLSFAAQNEAGSCLTVSGDLLDVAVCQTANADQMFIFGDTASESEGVADVEAASCTITSSASASQQTIPTYPPPFTFTGICEPVTVTVTALPTSTGGDSTISSTTTIFVTVGPLSSSTDDMTVSSTTTVFVTVVLSSATRSSKVVTTTTSQATTAAATSASFKSTIPRISISPSTTVVLSS